MNSTPYFLDAPLLERLFGICQSHGYEWMGPKVEDGAIHYRELGGLHDLPQGYSDEQSAGRYRLTQPGHQRWFHYNLAANSLKELLHPKNQRLFSIECRTCSVQMDEPLAPKLALLGARPCELEGARKLLAVHNHPNHKNSSTQLRRDHLLIVGVDCSKASDSCFCLSVGGGPEVKELADLALTELETGFLIRSLTDKGANLLKELQAPLATSIQLEQAQAQLQQVKEAIRPKLKALNLKENLQAKQHESVWQEVAAKCLGCGNCTQVCPTCFCVNYTDHTTIDGKQSTRHQIWDSCFSLDYSYIHGGYARKESAHRYRQWITHKLAGWVDQFFELGCSGCGRCITWCPVGIDITEEANKATSFSIP